MPANRQLYFTIEQKRQGLHSLAIESARNNQFRAMIYAAAISQGIQDLNRQYKEFLDMFFKQSAVYCPEEGELYIRPSDFVKAPIGDCDDFSLFVSGVLHMLAIEHDFIFDFDDSGHFYHVKIAAIGRNGEKLIFDYVE